MCQPEKGISCNKYSTCPILLANLQRNYMNRTLDAIFDTLHRIEKHLENLNNGQKITEKEDDA